LSGPFQTYAFDRQLIYPVSSQTVQSRFVLYENGAFALEYTGPGGGQFRGAYTKTNDAIVFRWEDSSAAGPWGAVGTLSGDSLTVEYNLIMQLTDFEDAVYVLVR
jgi:hypothetical protein